jgi:hypothetical protein
MEKREDVERRSRGMRRKAAGNRDGRLVLSRPRLPRDDGEFVWTLDSAACNQSTSARAIRINGFVGGNIQRAVFRIWQDCLISCCSGCTACS